MINYKDIDLIDQYLNDKLTEELLVAFNNRVKTDTEFAEEVELMKKISGGIKDIGRQEIRDKLKVITTRKREIRLRTKKIIYWSIAASLLLLVGSSVYFYLFINKTAEQKFVFNNILPPFKKADIKLKEFNIEAEKGAILSYKTGTIITIPKDAFTDNKGKVIKGNISVRYREFTNPAELFIAGIPMNYDSSGYKLNMQTAGVCELQVYKDDSVININPENKIKIDFSSKFENADYSLFLFDTITKKWSKKGEDNVIKTDEYTENTQYPDAFIPRKADISKPRLKLVPLNPSKFPELEVYKNYSFEISDNEKNYNPEVSKINWKSVSVNKDNKTGEYLVTFINPDKQITYRTNAVFEEEYYQMALNTYNQKIKERQPELLTEKESIKFQNANRIQNLQKELLEKEKNEFYAASIYRTFSIGKAGLWCYSKLINNLSGTNLTVNFLDTKGNKLDLKYIAILDKTQNTIIRYTPEEFKSLKFDTASENILLAITMDENLAYLKKEDFAKLPKSGKCSVTLQLYPKKPENFNEILSLI